MTAGLVSFSRGENPLRADKLNSGFSERLLRSGDAMTGPLLLTRDPVLPFEASTKQYIDALVSTALSGFLSITGGTLTGMLTLFADPTLPLHAATKRYVDNTLTNGYLPLVGGTLTGNLSIGVNATANPALTLNGAASTSRVVIYLTAGKPRWAAYTDGIVESGSNVGSDYRIDRYNDAGTALGNVLTITRSTGVAAFAQSPTGPTPATADNSTKFATTAYVLAQLAAAGAITEAPLDGKSYGRTSANWAAVLPLTGGTIGGDLAITSAGAGMALTITNTGGNGAGILLVGNGATTPNKYLRAFNGNFQVINSAFNTTIFTLSDAGALTIPGIITVGGNAVTSPALQINGAANTDKQVIFYSASAGRWVIATSNVYSAESGGNAGGDLIFGRYNDAGAYIATAMFINRASGVVTMGTGFTVSGGGASITGNVSITNNGGPANILTITNTTGASGAGILLTGNGATTPNKYIQSTNGYFRIVNHSFGAEILSLTDAGALTIPNGITVTAGGVAVGGAGTISTTGELLAGFAAIGRGAGNVGGFIGSWNSTNNDFMGFWSAGNTLNFGFSDLAGSPTVSYGSFDKSGNFYTVGSIFAGNSANFGLIKSGPTRLLRFDVSQWGYNFDTVSGLMQWVNAGGGALTTLDASGNFSLTTGTGYKPSGGSWAVYSDDRVKRDVAPYKAGLAELLRLNPIRYKFNGEGGTADDDVDCYGLSAQAAREVMPELVLELPDNGDEKRLSGQLALDASPLTFAMINAFAELNSRLQTLENA